MSHTRWMPLTLIAFAAGTLMTPTLVSASTQVAATSAAPGDGIVGQPVSVQKQRAAADYWTPAKMAAAKPLDITVDASKASGGGRSSTAASGAPGTVAPVTTSGKSVNTAPLAAVPSGSAGPTPTHYAYPFPFTRTAVAPTSLYTQSSRRQNGKVFFVQNGGNFVCSATVVTSSKKNEVWTAGHCLSDGTSTFNTNTVFVPAYNGNASSCCPYGKWTANGLWTTTRWHFNGDFYRDHGAFTVAPRSGVQIQNRVGAAGFAWNQARDQQFVDFGYPQAAPFNGKSMINCFGATAAVEARFAGDGPAPQAIGCDMTGGSSGGSWQIRWGGSTGGSPGLINGHNSYKWSDQPLAMYSPYVDTLANAVRCASQTAGTLGCP